MSVTESTPEGRTVDLDEVLRDLDAIQAQYEASTEREIAAMRAEGLEPADRTGETSAAVDGLGFVLRPAGDGIVEIRFSLGGEDGFGCLWGDLWPRPGARLPASELLASLCAAWPVVAGARLVGNDVRGGAAEIAAGSVPPVRTTRTGDALVVECGGSRRDMGSEGVLLVEILRALGDAAADLAASPSDAEDWRDLSARTDLPPWPVEGSRGIDDETAWYAAKSGLSSEDYVLGGLEAMCRQAAFALGEEADEPRPWDWMPSIAPSRPAAEIRALVADLASRTGETPESFEAGALATRNFEARRIHVFGHAPHDVPDDGLRP